MLLLAAVTLLPSLNARGQSAGAFSRMGFGARGIALGNALVADVSGSASPYYNPALAPFTSGQNLQVSVALLSFDRTLQFLQLAAPLQQRAGFAVGLIHAAVSNIDGRDAGGFHTADLSIDEYAGFLVFGIRLGGRVTGGIGLQMFRSDLSEGLKAVNSIGLDVGFTVKISEKTYLGLVLDDLLARYTWDTSGLNGSGGKTTTDRFPLRMRIGLMRSFLEERLRLFAEYESRVSVLEHVSSSVGFLGDEPVQFTDRTRLTFQENRFRFGAEYQILEQISVRGGLEQLGADALEGVRPATGFMIEQTVGMLKARFEYAFALESQASGMMHLLSLRLFL